MNDILKQIQQKAKKKQKHIILPEGSDERIVRAAIKIVADKLAYITLLGKQADIEKRFNVTLKDITVIDPEILDITPYANTLYELRKNKGMTQEEATKLAKKEMYLGVLMVQMGEADGLVAGAMHSTGEMLKPGLQIVKTLPGIKTVSSCFIMVLPETKEYGESGVFVFGDCAVNIEPTAEQLADIAIASAESAKTIAGITEPRVAMLSFSTKCSAVHPLVDKVNQAADIVHKKIPNLLISGDLQLDAAIEPKVACIKAPDSKVAGKANVLIFPDLQSGNIGYKLVERLAGAMAIGPICQGFNKPLNDLSRGCSIDDIINVVAITSLQA